MRSSERKKLPKLMPATIILLGKLNLISGMGLIDVESLNLNLVLSSSSQ